MKTSSVVAVVALAFVGLVYYQWSTNKNKKK